MQGHKRPRPIYTSKKTFTKMMLEVGMAVFTNTSAKSIETKH